MPATYWTGKYAKVSFASTNFPGKKFTVAIETTPVDVTNFNSPGAGTASAWREFRSGFSKGTVDVECVFDSSLPQISSFGDVFSFVGTLGTNETISCNCVLADYSYGQDVDGYATLKIKGMLTGMPTITFS